jgi:hypothetical protein
MTTAVGAMLSAFIVPPICLSEDDNIAGLVGRDILVGLDVLIILLGDDVVVDVVDGEVTFVYWQVVRARPAWMMNHYPRGTDDGSLIGLFISQSTFLLPQYPLFPLGADHLSGVQKPVFRSQWLLQSVLKDHFGIRVKQILRRPEEEVRVMLYE